MMAIAAHALDHPVIGTIEVYQNIPGVLIPAVGVKVHIVSLAIVSTQESDRLATEHLSLGPQPPSRQWQTGQAVDQAHLIELVWHGRQLAAHCPHRECESAIVHDRNMKRKLIAYNQISANSKCPIRPLSQKRAQSTLP